MNKFLTKIIGASLAIAMMIGVGVGVNANKAATEVNAADSGLTPSSGSFIIDFYDSTKLSSTSGTGLTNNNYSSFVKVADGLTKADVVTGVSVTGTVQYGKNGGLTAGTGTAAGSNSHYVSFSIGSDYAVNKCTLYGTAYESGRWKLNNNVADSGSLGSKGGAFSTISSPLVWDELNGATTLTFKKDDGNGGNQKRLTIYTIVCEYSAGGSSSKTSTTTAITVPNNKTTLDLAAAVTDTVQLSAEVSYESGTISNPEITWTSSNTGVATVSENGLVTPVARGRTSITASYTGDETYNGSSAHVDIDVVNSSEVYLDIATYAQGHSWENGTAYTSFTFEGVSFTVSGGGNNGKFYTSDNTWRMYSGGSLIITPPLGKSISSVTSDPSQTFTIASGGTSASKSFTSSVSLKNITIALGAEKVLDTISASITNTSRVWRTNDVVVASDLTVIPHYTDGTDGAAITNGEGVTVTNGTLQNVGNNTVNVSFGGKSTTVTVNALSSTIVEWTITGEIGETVKSTAYNLSGLTLHGWYDNEKTDEASASVVSAYGLVANPAVAGDAEDENNTIEVKVYANSDTGHSNCLKTFTNVAAPIIVAARGSEENPYTVAQARAAIDATAATLTNKYVTGIISQIDSYSETYHSLTYWISDDGTTTDQLQVYSGKGIDNANFSSTDDIEVGAQVTIKGDLKKFGSTYEFDKNNQLVSYTAPVRVLESIALSGTYPTEFLTGDAFSHEGMVVTATYDNGSHRDVTNDATFSGYNMSEAGQQTVTVSYEENGVTKTATYSITVTFVDRTAYNLYQGNAVIEGDYILYYNGNAVKNSLTSKRTDYVEVTPNNNTILTELDTIVWHIAHNGDYYTIYNVAADKYLASTDSKNEAALVDTATNNALWSIEVSEGANKTYDFVNKARAESNSNNGNKYLRFNNGYGFACYASGTAGALSLFKADAMSYLDSFDTEAKLVANETNGNIDYVAIKYTTKIAKYAWDAIADDYGISEFGMMVFGSRKETPLTVEEKFEAELDQNNPTTVRVVNADTYGLTLDEDGDYYSFTVKVVVSASNYDVKFCVAPYIVVNGTHHFLDNLTPSVNYLASNGLVESDLSPEALAALAG